MPGLNNKKPVSPPSNVSSNSTNTNNQSNIPQGGGNLSNTPQTQPKRSDTLPLSFTSASSKPQGGLGQFSPNIFTTRRVWVKRLQGTPTTIILHQNDIIDDLKQAVINKYPNSLSREVDPADLLIKMDLQARLPLNVASGTQSSTNNKKTFTNNALLLSSPDNLKSAKPIAPSGTPNQSNAYSYVNLEPDQNVWHLLDTYYPQGMTMQEAFIIETSDIEPTSNRSSFNVGYTSKDHRLSYLQGPQQARTLNPSQVLNASQKYYQPRPQYIHQSNLNLTTVHDKSVSPSTAVNGRQSPLPYGANIHRRSQSNPLQSPTSASANVSSNNTNENSQAVLLLPKNFSLATGGNAASNNPFYNRKRLSLDENFVQKNSNASTLNSPDESKTNLTNIGMGIHSQSHSVPEPYDLSPENPRNANNTNFNTSDAATSKGDTPGSDLFQQKDDNLDSDANRVDRLSITPSPPIEGSKANNLSLDQILSGEGGNRESSIKKKSIDNELKPTKSSKMTKSTTDTVLPSISVLVVEDNAINQAILGAFLRKYKIPYQIAKNGQEAVDKWKTGGFHLVLMDIQLPVKSGIEATKEIRHLEKINKIGVFAQHELSNNNITNPFEVKDNEKLDLTVFRSPVIIVALTASSNSSVDRKNALRAGCNDYLTKPVNLVWLQNKITEWGCMQTLINFDGWKEKRSVGRSQTTNSTTTNIK